MYKVTETFKAKMGGLELPPISFHSDQAPGLEAQASVNSIDGVTITVLVPSSPTKEAGREVAATVADELLSRLVFVAGRRAGRLKHDSGTAQKLDENGVPTQQVSLSATVQMDETLEVVLKKTDSGEVERQIVALDGDIEQLYGLYRSALSAEDSVHRYMALYNVLLFLFGDAQRKLDEFIREREPGVPEFPSPIRQNVSETIFTKLRNEFAHVRKGVALDETREGMRQRVDRLSDLTRTAISQLGPELQRPDESNVPK
jgi:hypothetical protein